MPETRTAARTAPAPTCRHRRRPACGCLSPLPPAGTDVPAARERDWTPWSTAFASNA